MSASRVLFSPGRLHSAEAGDILPEDSLPPSSFTKHRTPSCRTVLLPPLLRSPTPTRSRLQYFPSPSSASWRFDLVVRLPPEVALQILAYLHASDLCRVCQVCRYWDSLCHHPPLRRKRRKYLRVRREEFIATRENRTRGSTQRTTPQGPARVSGRCMTPAPSPLFSIQPRSVAKRPYPPSSPLSPIVPSHVTPSPANLLENVRKLSIAESNEMTVRRCLFPERDEPDPGSLHRPSSQAVAGHRANKSRLRRL